MAEDKTPAPVVIRNSWEDSETEDYCDCPTSYDNDEGECMLCRLPIQYRNNP